MSNIFTFHSLLWEGHSDWPQILVCYSTIKSESLYKFSASPLPPVACGANLKFQKHRKKAFFAFFQMLIAQSQMNIFQFCDRHFSGFSLQFFLKIIGRPYRATPSLPDDFK